MARSATPASSMVSPQVRRNPAQLRRRNVAFPRMSRTDLSLAVADEAPTSWTIEASGVTIGRYPRLAARCERSVSSPYMKYTGSKPPSSFHTERGTRQREPVITPTSRTESLCQFPSASGLKYRDVGNAVDRPKPKHVRLHQLGSAQDERGSRVPPGRTVRPPYNP